MSLVAAAALVGTTVYVLFHRRAQTTDEAAALIQEMALRWQRDLLTNVVPFWDTHSLDKDFGGYFTALAEWKPSRRHQIRVAASESGVDMVTALQ